MTFSTEQAKQALALAQQTLDIEIAALQRVKLRLNDQFALAVQHLLNCTGRVVVLGVGKSGHIGRKVAATLASTGTPAMFVHAAEASHGDLGMITAADAVLAISNSGANDEIVALLPLLKRFGNTLIAITGKPDSPLAQHATVVLDNSVEKEACPLNLAPTASTTAQLALGDALAVALLDARGFKAADFARSHPGGALGRKLLTHVRDIMRTGAAVPKVLSTASLFELLQEMSQKGLGAAAVVNEGNALLGIFTDGDLRRLLQTDAAKNLQSLTAKDVMHANPQSLQADLLAVAAAELMERKRITSVLVTDGSGQLIGALNSHDLMQAKVI